MPVADMDNFSMWSGVVAPANDGEKAKSNGASKHVGMMDARTYDCKSGDRSTSLHEPRNGLTMTASDDRNASET